MVLNVKIKCLLDKAGMIVKNLFDRFNLVLLGQKILIE